MIEQKLSIAKRLESAIPEKIGIQEFVKKLKPKCIQIINLLFFKGYTQQEASDELEIPLGTVKTQNRNCINDLRNFLQV